MIPERYNVSNIIASIKQPGKVVREFKRLVHLVVHAPKKYHFLYSNQILDSIADEDWDNLVILDACRYDVYNDVYNMRGNLKEKTMGSSNSEEFCERYFEGEDMTDAVYVTANPFGAQVEPGTFYRKYVTFAGGLDPESSLSEGLNVNKTWSPGTVYQKSTEAYEENPNKRLIIHFMQPHAPYFGKKAEQLRMKLRKQGIRFWAWNDHLSQDDIDNDSVLWHLETAAYEGYISVEELREVYIENLETVLQYVERLLEEIPGKTIITADHGEMLGENAILTPADMSGLNSNIGHGRGVYTEELRKVPWMEIDSDQRRETTNEEPTESRTDEDVLGVNGQLRALGYK